MARSPCSRSSLSLSSLLLVLASGALGCLVTEKINFEVVNTPATLRDAQPLTFTRVPSTVDPGCFAFSVRIVDPDIEDALNARLLVNGELAEQRNLAPTGASDRGLLQICAKPNRLNQSCNHVELLVSRQFVDNEQDNPYDTVDPDDFARLEWWVLGRADSTPRANPEDCAMWIDGGAP